MKNYISSNEYFSFINENLSLDNCEYEYCEQKKIISIIDNNLGNKIFVILKAVNSINYSKFILEITEFIEIGDRILIYGNNYSSNNNVFYKKNIPEAKLLGFFYALGFQLQTDKQKNNEKYYSFHKTHKVNNIYLNYSKSFLIRLKRIGKDKKIINVYKFRTMHVFSEFLHDYMIENYGYNTQGKINNDFRITSFGRILRKFYLDEIPQIINILKGDINIVGCRPVSSAFLRNYSDNILNLRSKFKPGFISPANAENAKSIDEIIKVETEYLIRKANNPIKTDIIVFFKSLINVFLGINRSL